MMYYGIAQKARHMLVDGSSRSRPKRAENAVN